MPGILPPQTEDGIISRAVILDVITKHMKRTAGQPPTFEQIGQDAFLSRGGVKHHIAIMLELGILARVSGRRGLIIPGSCWLTPEEAAIWHALSGSQPPDKLPNAGHSSTAKTPTP